jgi:hypothetical protein
MLKRLANRVIDGASWPRVGLLLLAYVACVSVLDFADARLQQLSSGLGALAVTALRGRLVTG